MKLTGEIMKTTTKEKMLIIGGSSGMGLATAKLAYENNYDVIIASRSIEKLNQAKQDMFMEDVKIVTVDIRDENSIQALFQSVGKVHHLVISGSEIKYGNIHNTPVDEAKASFDSKFFGPFRLIQQALNFLEVNGSITLFSGTSGTKPEKGSEILSAINAAVDSFARALAISLAPIRVNSIAPGIIDTPAYDGIDEETKKYFKQFTDKLLVKRMGQANEVARAALYLVENAYVTGTTLYIDGGHVIS